MSDWTAERILRTYTEVFPEVAKDRFVANACLGATRVSLTMLELFAIKARALPVQLLAYNDALTRRMEARHPAPKTPEEMDAMGGWSVGIGFGTNKPEAEKGWDGHMVLVTESPLLPQQFLVDLTAGQASRPEKALMIPPTLTVVLTPEFVAGTAPLLIKVGDCLLCYQHHPSPPPWEDAPDWSDVRLLERNVMQVALCRALEQRGVPLEAAQPLPDRRARHLRRA